MANTSKKDSSKDGQDVKATAKYKFQNGEKVLCFHGPLIYEAKCLQKRLNEKSSTPEYHIHYSGWNKNWDEWVPERRVLKFNADNVLRQKDLYKSQKAEPKGRKAKKRTMSGQEESPRSDDKSSSNNSTPTPEKRPAGGTKDTGSSHDSSSDAKRKRPKSDPTVETEEQFLRKVELRIKIPDELKPWIVDDWDLISKSKKLVLLPARVNVETIIAGYLEKSKLSPKNTADKEADREAMTDGIMDYFNSMLGPQLLYKIERKQHADLTKAHPNKAMSEIYGAIHLLRLFFKLGGALAYTSIDEKKAQVMTGYISDFLNYLYNNRNSYYDMKIDYIPFPPEYLK